MTGDTLGAVCTSSMTTCSPSRARKPWGSSAAAARAVASSRVIRDAEVPSAGRVTSVLFPVWRAPLRSTAGVSARAAVISGSIFRRHMVTYSPHAGELSMKQRPVTRVMQQTAEMSTRRTRQAATRTYQTPGIKRNRTRLE